MRGFFNKSIDNSGSLNNPNPGPMNSTNRTSNNNATNSQSASTEKLP